jgi:hypothetical protein
MLAVVALAVPICAQPPTAVADIPFAFVAGNNAMPAGTYTVSVQSGSIAVALVGPDLHTHLLNTVPGSTRSDSDLPVLAFHRYGDQYFLSGIRAVGGSREFPATRMEREAMGTASARRAGQLVVLAMR